MKALIAIAIALLFTGCANAQKKVRHDVYAEMETLVTNADCPTACDLLKTYLKIKLSEFE